MMIMMISIAPSSGSWWIMTLSGTDGARRVRARAALPFGAASSLRTPPSYSRRARVSDATSVVGRFHIASSASFAPARATVARHCSERSRIRRTISASIRRTKSERCGSADSVQLRPIDCVGTEIQTTIALASCHAASIASSIGSALLIGHARSPLRVSLPVRLPGLDDRGVERLLGKGLDQVADVLFFLVCAEADRDLEIVGSASEQDARRVRLAGDEIYSTTWRASISATVITRRGAGVNLQKSSSLCRRSLRARRRRIIEKDL